MEQKVKSQMPNSQVFSFDEHLPLAHGGSDSRCSAGRSEQQLRGVVQGRNSSLGRAGGDPGPPHGGAALPAGSPVPLLSG